MVKHWYAKVIFRGIVLVGMLLCFGCLSCETKTMAMEVSKLVPDIEIRPGIEVEVNEEVFFSGEGTTYPDAFALQRARYEWDFGDGYCVKYGAPTKKTQDSGLAVTHYYMKPGTYTVTMTVSVFDEFDASGFIATGEAIDTSTVSTQVTVKGEEPMAGFEVLHAPFSTRIAQFMTAVIPQNVVEDASNRLVAKFVGDKVGNTWILCDKTGLTAEEKFLVDYRELPADTYHFEAVLLNAQGEKLGGIWRESFSKSYDGIPSVGINEWNSICVEGEPYFPVTPYMTNTNKFDLFEGAINTTHTIGYYNAAPDEQHTPDLWLDYLNVSKEKGYMGIGPGRGEITYPARNGRTTSIRRIRQFVEIGKGHDAMLCWNWFDEPNLGGQAKQVPPPVISAWNYATREIDDQHPIIITNAGSTWRPDYETYHPYYNYQGSTILNARHSFYSDILAFDTYPLEYRLEDPYYFNKSRGVIDLWVQAIENHKEKAAANMVPTVAALEVCDVRSYRGTPGPTASQVLMESWLAVVHGVKGVLYFPFFEYDTIQYGAMREFTLAINTFDRIVLSADVPEEEWITDDSNVRNNRVDTLTKKDGKDTYLFAVRLTEPEPLATETNHILVYDENKIITTTFTIPGFTDGTAYVLNASGEVEETIAIANGTFRDTFNKEEYAIYRIADANPGQPLFGDVNSDGRVNMSDLAFLAKNMGKTSHSADWILIKRADVNADQKVNILDLVMVGKLVKTQ